MKTDLQLLLEAKSLLHELVQSREFILYVGLDGSYHNKVKQWFDDIHSAELERIKCDQ